MWNGFIFVFDFKIQMTMHNRNSNEIKLHYANDGKWTEWKMWMVMTVQRFARTTQIIIRNSNGDNGCLKYIICLLSDHFDMIGVEWSF